MDSVYSVFINEINVVEDKKTRLKSKINEEEVKSINAEKEKTELNLNTFEIEIAAWSENLNSRLSTAGMQVDTLENKRKEIVEVQITDLEEIINDRKEQIKALQIEFGRPKIKLSDIIPYGILLVGLLAYIFMFYSSAAYILIFSEADAEQARMQGIKIPPPEVFNPDAIALSWDKGFGALIFVLFFVFIPLGFSLFDRFVNWNKVWATIISFVLILLYDVFIAYKVAESIHNVQYLTGAIDAVWLPSQVVYDINFYLVFILGAGGLFLFKYLYNIFISIFEARNPDIDKQRKCWRSNRNRLKLINIKRELRFVRKKSF